MNQQVKTIELIENIETFIAIVEKKCLRWLVDLLADSKQDANVSVSVLLVRFKDEAQTLAKVILTLSSPRFELLFMG